MSTTTAKYSTNSSAEILARPKQSTRAPGSKLGRLPAKIWFSIASSRIVQHFRTLLRTLGLGIVTFFRGDEEPKVLVDSSIWLALARCAIHVVPSFLSIGLITMNLIGYFIGDELEGIQDQDDLKFGLLQVAAKAQELLIVASVGAVIFHVLRSELIFGDGVPLGLLVSGFSFAQISYFFSAEFWGGLVCSESMSRKQRWRRRAFAALVFIGGALALLAGPATALLMIPRTLDWPVGGGIYWLNGSEQQLWPTTLNADYYSEIDCGLEDSQFTDNRCPSQGFLSLYQHFSSWWNNYNTGYSFELRDGFMRKAMYARPSLISDANTWAFSAHAATATLQDALRGIHQNALQLLADQHPLRPPFPAHLVWAKPMRYEVETKVPAARVWCQAQGVLEIEGDSLMLEFPNLKGVDKYWESNPGPEVRAPHGAPVLDKVDVLEAVQRNLAARGILEDRQSRLNRSIFDESRSTLIVPTDIWNTTGNSLGVVVFFDTIWNRTNEDLWPASNILACSIDARWAKGKTVTEMTMNTRIDHEYHLGRVLNLVETELEFQPLIGYIRAIPPNNASMETIRLTTDWYDMLAPILPDEAPESLPWLPVRGSKRSTLEVLLSLLFNKDLSPQTEFENLIATTFVDGISRSGLIPNRNASRFLEGWGFPDFTVKNESQARSLVRKGDPVQIFSEPEILKGGNMTRREMKAIYHGYVMTATGWFDYLSIAGLLMHAVIALLHTILVIFKRRTSGAWDSILELVTLTQRSTPPPESLLSNTSAGVQSFKTVKLIAWVEAPENGTTSATDDKSIPGGELQMRFRDGWERRDPKLKPDMDKGYTVPIRDSI
ncbi:hypothetical protein FZEAL_6226 [Fusarium zealandicum]|uniref:Uncharacterized protein n=1 Tax=Fusarium zealandicum TaxID=1053134 RepID=A0A8H4XJ24_9HYPO|nr:hypothetical protein FZEAL_6226 [Fusarium zealandicum]